MYWIGPRSCGITFGKMFIRAHESLCSRLVAGLALLVGVTLAHGVSAQEPKPQDAPQRPEETTLPPVVVTAPPPVSSSSEVFIPGRDFELLPQDGTDIALFVDGLPVNFRSHAHGQGYADLHFLVPELVQRLDGFKGPYFPEFGDFATAGAFNFVMRDTVDENYAEAGGGSWATQRYLTLFSPTRDALKTLVAIEYYRSDGPFTHPNGYERFNLFAKAKATLTEGMDLSVWASYYQADWHGSGEIPVRAVRSGLIGRSDAIDPNEGGSTQRANVNLDWRWRPDDNQLVTLHAYGTYYSLTLFDDFTFFLNDQQNGDMITQRDRRYMAGFDALYQHQSKPFDISLTSSAGFQYRIDTPRVVLATAVQRHQLARTQDVSIVEQSYSPFVKFDMVPLSWLRFVTGARGDFFSYHVHSRVNTTEDDLNGSVTDARPNVKANLVLGPWYQTEFFANFGTGYHSNDARAVVADSTQTALPTAQGYEFGVRSKAIPRTELSLTYWVLDLASELVFVGDEGTTEARGPSHREGIEFAMRVKILDWLTFSGDVTASRAEFDTGAAVALAPRLTSRADLTARMPWGLSASFAMRYLGDRYADEDRHQTARGYLLFDLTARYRYKWLEAFLSIENLTNVEYREAQFFFNSRLAGEPTGGVPDIHYTPGNPLTVFGGLAVRF